MILVKITIDLKRGFNECWRVLAPYGVLIFKWNEAEIRLKKVVELFPEEPLFGHPIMSKTRTHWLCFMKIPRGVKHGFEGQD